MKKQNLLIIGTVALGVGIILTMHGYTRMSTLTAAFHRLGGSPGPGSGELVLGVLACIAGVVIIIVGAVRKTSETMEGVDSSIKAAPNTTHHAKLKNSGSEM